MKYGATAVIWAALHFFLGGGVKLCKYVILSVESRYVLMVNWFYYPVRSRAFPSVTVIILLFL